MKAIQVKEYGDERVLQITDVPIPKPGPDEVLVQLKAAGLNFIDIYMRSGYYPHALPYVPGYEGSGIVSEIGSNVSGVSVGDRVAYTGALGSYAEYNLVNAAQLIPLPDELSFEEGAAFPLQGLTAQYLVNDFYTIKPNDYVLIHAAAGGVGLLLVQWVKHLKGIVIGTVSTSEKASIVKEAGADHVILYTEQDFVEEVKRITQGKGADYIIDGVGKTTFTKDLDAARKYGHICIFGSASGPAEPLAPNSLQAKSLTISGGSIFNCMNSREELLERARMVLNGIREQWLKLNIDHIFSLEDASKAHALLKGRQTTGKVILKI